MDNRTKGIIATVATAVVCGCLGLFACVFGALGALGRPFETNVNGVTGSAPMPTQLGYVLLCLSLILFAIPVGVGFFTLRMKTAPKLPGEPMPPAS
jgi:hypothetical protein